MTKQTPSPRRGGRAQAGSGCRPVKAGEDLADRIACAEVIARTRPSDALDCVDEVIRVASTPTDRELIATALCARGDILHRLGRIPEAMLAFDEARRVAHDTNPVLTARSINGLALATAQSGRPLDSLSLFHEALAAFRDAGDAVAEATVLANIGCAFAELGRFAQALEYHESALERFAHADYATGRIAALNNIANVYSSTGDHLRALERRHQALELALECEEEWLVPTTHEGIARSYANMGDLQNAEKHYDRCRQAACGLEDRRMEGAALCGLASVRIRRGDLDRARRDLDDALAILDGAGSPQDICEAQLWYAQLELGADAAAEAERRAAIALDLAEQHGSRRIVARAHELLARIHRASGDLAAALQHHEEFSRLRELSLQEETVERIQSQKAVHESEKARRDVDLYRLQSEKLELQLERQRAELAAQAMSLARQSELLGRFRNELRAILHGSSDAHQCLRAIQEKLRELPCQTIDWTRFEAEFQSTYPEFRQKLVERYPDLTKTEVRIASFLKLKLTTPDIAQLMCLSERTVEQHRYNIRKKIRAEQGRELGEIFEKI